MSVDYLLGVMRDNASLIGLATDTQVWTYDDILTHVDYWTDTLTQVGLTPGTAIALVGDYHVESIAALLATIRIGGIAVPLSTDSYTQHQSFMETAQVQWLVDCASRTVEATSHATNHPLYTTLSTRQHAGLVLFTSGSTGHNKAAVHDFEALLEKFTQPRKRLCTIVFLQLDHIGGINTLLYTFHNGGCAVIAPDRSPDSVCRLIEQRSVELLPTSPTFLNLLLLSSEMERRDLSSLRLITYGTEPMPAATLEKAHKSFPDARFQQTYGSTELGILRSKSRSDGSLWVRLGGEGYETKVVDGTLRVRAHSAMLGYLNASVDFDDEGYLDTGDEVEVDGSWMRIIGRRSEVINVGGLKVHPAQVESALLELDDVVDAAVSAEPNALTGNIVAARIRVKDTTDTSALKASVRRHCKTRLPGSAIPRRIEFTTENLHSTRFKRQR